MTAKEYLRQAYWLNERIDSHVAELESAKKLSTTIRGLGYGEQIPSGSSRKEAPFVNTLMKIMEMEERIDREIDALVDLKAEMNAAIDQVAAIDEQMVLRYRYLENKTWEDIAERLTISVRSVHRLHAKALKDFRVPA